jgi:hypothetical protein
MYLCLVVFCKAIKLRKQCCNWTTTPTNIPRRFGGSPLGSRGNVVEVNTTIVDTIGMGLRELIAIVLVIIELVGVAFILYEYICPMCSYCYMVCGSDQPR